MTIQPTTPDWPTEWQGCRLVGRYLGSNGQPKVGTVILKPSVRAVLSLLSNVVLVGDTLELTLDATGAFDIIVPATDDPDTNPTAWTWEVTENFPGGRKFSISAPANTTQKITEVAPVPASKGEAIVRGKSAYEVAVDNGFVGTEVEWLASLVGGGEGGGGLVASVNGKIGAVVLAAADVGAAPAGHGHTIANVAGLQGALDGKQPSGSYVVTTDPRLSDARTPLAHAHDDRYYTETETDQLLDGRQPAGDYATNSALTSGLEGKADAGHTHTLDSLGTVPVSGCTGIEVVDALPVTPVATVLYIVRAAP